MFLLGYGMVQYPRSLWMQSDLDYYLLRTQMRASVDFKAIGESQLSVSLVVSDVMKTKAEVRRDAILLLLHVTPFWDSQLSFLLIKLVFRLLFSVYCMLTSQRQYRLYPQISQYADVKLNDAMDILVAECPPEFRSSKMGKVATNKKGQVGYRAKLS